MELYELDDLIQGLPIEPTLAQLNELLAAFKKDFLEKEFFIKGLRVKVIENSSKVDGFERYPETFVHLITRKGESGKRVFDRHRANKIHWVKCILEHWQEEEISFFQFPESNGRMRDYYWYKEGNFLVILEKITPDYIVVTSFYIDNKRNIIYFEKKEKWYRTYQK